MPYFVYFMSNRRGGTIYVGVTNDLIRRVHEHRTNSVAGFTSRYNLHRLVYFEQHQSIATAIQREKSIKRWMRQWKINVIEEFNPEWDDLYQTIAT